MLKTAAGCEALVRLIDAPARRIGFAEHGTISRSSLEASNSP
jgi:hypothetical protein